MFKLLKPIFKSTMKSIIFLLALLSFVQYIFGNEGILSKFHQHTYKLKDVRIQLMSYNKDYIKFFEIKAFKYNRTTTAHNGTINIKVDAKDKVEVITQLYKFLSNEYRLMAVRFQVNLQKAFEANAMGLHAIAKCGNVTSFYFYKDITYFACNFVIDETRFPPMIPNGRYKVELTFLFFNKEVAVVHIFSEVYTPIVYPKN